MTNVVKTLHFNLQRVTLMYKKNSKYGIKMYIINMHHFQTNVYGGVHL